MKVTYYGHSCFAAEIAGKTLLFDPFISPNPLASAIDPASLAADYILLSHGHEDHVADAEAIARRTGATIISNFEIVSWYGRKGLTKLHPMNLGGAFKFDFGRLKYVSAIHSSVLPDGTYGGNPGGFVVESRDGDFYYSGDTALTQDMKLIGEYAKLDFAVLCVGDNFTMGFEDAIRASDFIRCDRILGVHYDTFPPIKIDHAAAINRFRSSDKHLLLLDIGQSTDF
jgi:L-ascorbate metabolism protein UlaG (beta-lactamase superfamily)